MTTFLTQCRHCGESISVEVDVDAYSSLGLDPMRLIGAAACNRCTDLRAERERLERKIASAAKGLILLGPEICKEREALRMVLARRTQEYSRLIARWHYAEGSLWEESLVDSLMEHPDQWPAVLSQMWKAFAQWQQSQTAQLPGIKTAHAAS